MRDEFITDFSTTSTSFFRPKLCQSMPISFFYPEFFSLLNTLIFDLFTTFLNLTLSIIASVITRYLCIWLYP